MIRVISIDTGFLEVCESPESDANRCNGFGEGPRKSRQGVALLAPQFWKSASHQKVSQTSGIDDRE